MKILVIGIPRSGTSMMMQALRAGGVPVLADADYEYHLQRRYPDRNPCGFFEVRDKAAGVAGLSDGSAIKLFPFFVPKMPFTAGRYAAIVIERDESARQASYAAMTGGASKVSPETMQHNLATARSWMAARSDQFTVLELRYESVIADYQAAMRQIAAHLIPIPFAAEAAAEALRNRTDCARLVGLRGLGDLVAKVATPIARVIGADCIDKRTNQLKTESDCAKRQAKLNAAVPFGTAPVKQSQIKNTLTK